MDDLSKSDSIIDNAEDLALKLRGFDEEAYETAMELASRFALLGMFHFCLKYLLIMLRFQTFPNVRCRYLRYRFLRWRKNR
jgi:hypothetical protein